MFLSFFYLLRQRGLDVAPNEWMTLLEALEKNLHQCSLTGFYHLCRSIVVKSETEYDRFDQVFLEFFKDVPFHEELPDELMRWLDHPMEDLKKSLEELQKAGFPEESLENLLKQLEERLKEQDAAHDGGGKWVGTQGTSPFGNNGSHANGIRIGGESHHRTAMSVAGERKFHDFRKDNTLDTRQFQMAFRLLRQLSVQADDREKVLDIDGTIRETCDNAGSLKIQYTNARKNSVKVLLLMDSGGSMAPYADLCSMLFQAAVKSNHFKELHTYYFHNCVYSEVYTSPRLLPEEEVTTEWLLRNFDSSYKVILVGDAAMNPAELYDKRYIWSTRTYGAPGWEWLEKLKKQYPYLIWLNPDPLPDCSNFFTSTHIELAQLLPMYQLTAEGLEAGMKSLMVRR